MALRFLGPADEARVAAGRPRRVQSDRPVRIAGTDERHPGDDVVHARVVAGARREHCGNGGRISEAPYQTNVYIVESSAPPAGVGEPGVPPMVPALTNAIFAATGKRVRELPLSRTKLGA